MSIEYVSPADAAGTELGWILGLEAERETESPAEAERRWLGLAERVLEIEPRHDQA